MDPTLKARISAQLLEDMPKYSNALSRAGKYVLDHPAEFGVHSIRESAARIGVSTNTLVRLSEALGFSSFDDLRAPFRDALLVSEVTTEDVGWLRRLNKKSGLASIQAEASASAIGNVSKTLRDLDPGTLERVVKRLFDANHIFVVGVRASYSLAYYFHYVARMTLPNISLIPRQMNPAIDDLAFAGRADLLFAVTAYPYSLDTIRTCKFAHDKGMGLVLLSDSPCLGARPSSRRGLGRLDRQHLSLYQLHGDDGGGRNAVGGDRLLRRRERQNADCRVRRTARPNGCLLAAAEIKQMF